MEKIKHGYCAVLRLYEFVAWDDEPFQGIHVCEKRTTREEAAGDLHMLMMSAYLDFAEGKPQKVDEDEYAQDLHNNIASSDYCRRELSPNAIMSGHIMEWNGLWLVIKG